jgi:hypothetical protein
MMNHTAVCGTFTLMPSLTLRVKGYLKGCLGAMYHCGKPLSETLPIVEKMRFAIPEMLKIWQYSSLAMDSKNDWYWPYLAFEEVVHKALEDGELTMDAPVLPSQEQNDPF